LLERIDKKESRPTENLARAGEDRVGSPHHDQAALVKVV
jgi:hypothetical protein